MAIFSSVFKLQLETDQDHGGQRGDRLKIQSISDQLEYMSENSISKTEIDTVVKDIECLFQNTSNTTFGTKKKNTNTTNNNKPLYNFEFKAARNTYHKLRKLYNKYKSEHYKITENCN